MYEEIERRILMSIQFAAVETVLVRAIYERKGIKITGPEIEKENWARNPYPPAT